MNKGGTTEFGLVVRGCSAESANAVGGLVPAKPILEIVEPGLLVDGHAFEAYRIAKNNLSNLLGYNLPHEIWEDIPLNLTDALDAAPYQVDLPAAIQQALSRRTELIALRKTAELQRLNVVNARAGYKPTVQAFAGYTWNNSQFMDPNDIGYTLYGWNVGGQVSWNIFDGMLTRGRVVQAKALYDKAKTDIEDTGRQIELEVRTADRCCRCHCLHST